MSYIIKRPLFSLKKTIILFDLMRSVAQLRKITAKSEGLVADNKQAAVLPVNSQGFNWGPFELEILACVLVK